MTACTLTARYVNEYDENFALSGISQHAGIDNGELVRLIELFLKVLDWRVHITEEEHYNACMAIR